MLWTDDGKIQVHGTWIKNIVRAYRKDEVDTRIKELEDENKRLQKGLDGMTNVAQRRLKELEQIIKEIKNED